MASSYPKGTVTMGYLMKPIPDNNDGLAGVSTANHRVFADLDGDNFVDSVVSSMANLPGGRGEPDGHTNVILLKEDESVEIVLVEYKSEAFLIRDPNHWIKRWRARG
jgi:hypothetical protein